MPIFEAADERPTWIQSPHDGPPIAATFTSAGSVVIRRPIPRNLGIQLVSSTDASSQWAAIAKLENCMEPVAWLDMTLRFISHMNGSPMAIKDPLVRNFKHFKPSQVLGRASIKWWEQQGDTLEIWRGCYKGMNEVGLCWSLDPKTATQYAREGLWTGAPPLLIEATVKAGDFIAHKRSRDELVILVAPGKAKVVTVHALPVPEEFFERWQQQEALKVARRKSEEFVRPHLTSPAPELPPVGVPAASPAPRLEGQVQVPGCGADGSHVARIRIDGEGRFHLHDLYCATGGGRKLDPAHWLRRAQTKALIRRLSVWAEASKAPPPTNTVLPSEAADCGLYVVDHLAASYALWVGEAFHAKLRGALASAQAEAA